MNADSLAAKAKPEANSNQKAPHIAWLLAAIFLVAWSCLRFPEATLTPLPDPSWAGALIHAHESGMQFGKDIVFTYGPLGFLSIECFSPYAAVPRMVFEVLAGLGIATGICLAAWRMTWFWRFAFLGYFILAASPLHWGGDALFLDIGIFAWALLCFLEPDDRVARFVVPLILLSATGALVKFTFLMTGAFTIVLLAGDLALRGRSALAVGMILGYTLAFLLGWSLLGQSLSALPSFLSTSYAVADGYNQTMGIRDISMTGIIAMTLTAVMALTLRALAVPDTTTNPPWRKRMLLGIWTFGSLFVVWKYACVRTDYDHVSLMCGILPLMAFAAEAVPAKSTIILFFSRIGALACVGTALLVIHSQIPGFFPSILVKHAGINFGKSLGTLIQPGRYLQEKTEALQAEKKQDSLPKIAKIIGRRSVDIFGQNQGFALLNDFDYRPRPIFQSYAAYSRRMAELNEAYYLSEAAPDYVLFNLQAIDNRFPPLEDAKVLANLLMNYRGIATEGDYLLLRRNSIVGTKLTLITEGDVRAGEKIALPQNGAKLWLEIELRETPLGRAQGFVYKPAEVALVVWNGSEHPPAAKFNAPASMLSAGFLASPTLLDTGDVSNFFGKGKTRIPDAYSIELSPLSEKSYQPRIRFRLYQIKTFSAGASSP